MTPRYRWTLVIVLLLGYLTSMIVSSAQPGIAASLESSTLYNASGEIIATSTTGSEQTTVQQRSAGTMATSILMSENFEGVWPAPNWTISDLSTNDGGEFLWGKRNCTPRTGAFSGWAIGGGTQGSALPCNSNYPNNARVRALYGPFDLTGATNASLSYYIRGRTESSLSCSFDYLGVASSTNLNGPFTGNAPECGDLTGGTAGNGYVQRSLSLNGKLGQSKVWIAFFFVSDSSKTDIGISIDDLTVNVDTVPAATSYIISGTVRDMQANPVAGVQVIALPSQVGQSLTITETAFDGTYTFNVIAGTYNIQASKQGFFSGNVFGVTVPPNRTGADMTLMSDSTPTSTPSATVTASPSSTSTASATTTPTTLSTTSPTSLRAYLPLVIKEGLPTAN